MSQITQILDKKALTQIWLSEKLGKSYNMANSYMQNRRQPSIKILFEIAELLKIEAKELLANNTTINERCFPLFGQ